MVEPWLNTFDVIKKTYTDPSLLAPRLASVKSAFLVVKVDQGIEGNLRIDFEREVDYTTPVARTLILDLLEDFGAELPEMKTWSLSFDKKTAVEMSGRLSEESVRKVLSMAHVPRLSADRPATAEAPATAKAEPKATNPPVVPYTRTQSDVVATSQAYFRSVTAMIEGLKKTERPTYRSTKLWYDRYAKQIEELPILGVDKELLDWGSMVARTMREMSSGINYYSQNQKYTLASTPSGYYGGYGAYYGNSRAYDASVIKKQSDADDERRPGHAMAGGGDLRRRHAPQDGREVQGGLLTAVPITTERAWHPGVAPARTSRCVLVSDAGRVFRGASPPSGPSPSGSSP